MDLAVKDVALRDFRNYENFDCGEFSNFNVFIGHNGSGKTNLIEAIQLLTSLCSFRNPRWDEVVRWGCNEACIEATFCGSQRSLDMRMRVANRRRSYFLNGKLKSSKELRGILPSVLFCPDDLRIVKGYSETRRESLDSLGGQISKTYYELKSNYSKAIKQKSALLQSEYLDPSSLEPWNENISVLGSLFVKHRLNLFERFRENMVGTYLEMVKETVIDITYSPSWDEEGIELRQSIYSADEIAQKLSMKMDALKDAEIASKKVLVGPQKDDVKIYIDGKEAKKYASQGQQRFVTLSWKIAEMKTIEEICGSRPILLLDDVLSELDKGKKEILAKYLLDGTQTFITATDVDSLDGDILDNAKVFDIGS